jgi:hypothetical protein
VGGGLEDAGAFRVREHSGQSRVGNGMRGGSLNGMVLVGGGSELSILPAFPGLRDN